VLNTDVLGGRTCTSVMPPSIPGSGAWRAAAANLSDLRRWAARRVIRTHRRLVAHPPLVEAGWRGVPAVGPGVDRYGAKFCGRDCAAASSAAGDHALGQRLGRPGRSGRREDGPGPLNQQPVSPWPDSARSGGAWPGAAAGLPAASLLWTGLAAHRPPNPASDAVVTAWSTPGPPLRPWRGAEPTAADGLAALSRRLPAAAGCECPASTAVACRMAAGMDGLAQAEPAVWGGGERISS